MNTGFAPALLASLLATSSASWAAGPSRPGNLRFDVYSDTAAELFWTRSIDDGRVIGYEIRINGDVATVRDGSSYFMRTLTKGVPYEFTVTALDEAGNRSRPASVSFIGGDQGPGDTGDGDPLKPTNLRSATYSSTAIELFWDRVPDANLSYEVSINDAVVATTQGVSHFSDTLERGQRYAFTVVAIDAAGNRSDAALILADTAGRPISIPPPAPVTPANVRILVYSRTAAELFWDRASAEADIVRTEIRRDDAVVGMVEGNSFFDDTREAGARYTYGLTAIDSRGNRSVTTEVMETPATTVINRDNYIALIATALPAFSGENFVGLLNEATDRIVTDFLGEVFASDPMFLSAYACSNGGTAFFDGSPLFIEFTDCQIDDIVVDGDFSYFPSNATEVGSRGLSITSHPDTTLRFDGLVNVPGNTFYRTTDVNARLMSPTDSLSLAGVNTQFSFVHLLRCCTSSRNFIAEFEGSFDFVSTATDGQSIGVATVTAFRYSEPLDTHAGDWNYRIGVLQLSAEDGSEVILDAETGDDTTVDIRLTSEVGLEEFVQPWSLWQGVLRRAP